MNLLSKMARGGASASHAGPDSVTTSVGILARGLPAAETSALLRGERERGGL
jgi:hypothetical protein